MLEYRKLNKWKKIILCIILVSVLSILTSCSELDLSVQTERYVMIIMPDGSIIQGICTNFVPHTNNYMYVKVDGVEYYLNSWRVVMWEE